MSTENFGSNFFPHLDSSGNRTLRKINNESHAIHGNKIVLNEVINEEKGITITGYTEVALGTIPSATQYVVDYTYRVITFNPTQEGKTVYVAYYGEGYMVVDNAMIGTFDSSGNLIGTFADEVTAIKADYATIRTAFDEFLNANIFKYKWYHLDVTQTYTTFSMSLIPDLVYNPLADFMMIMVGNILLREGTDYTIASSTITFGTDVIKPTTEYPILDLHFLILRGYQEELGTPTGDGALIINGSITKMKLDASLQAIIDSISTKANNTDASRTTTDKTVTGAINELNSLKALKTETIQLIDHGATVTDANSITTDGMHKCSKWTNCPVTGAGYDSYGKIFAVSYHPSFVKQIYFCTYYHNKVFFRSRSSDAWSDWEEFVFKDNTVPYTEITASTNMNTTVGRGVYMGTTWTNFPSGATASGVLEVFRVDTNNLQQVYHAMNTSDIYIRNLIGGAWSAWTRMAVTTNHTMPLYSNWVAFDNTPNVTVVGNMASVNMRIKNGLPQANSVIANIGKVPISANNFFPITTPTGTTVGGVYVDATGNIKLQYLSNNSDCCLNFVCNVQ